MENPTKNFEIDFIKGCLAFLQVASVVKGDDRNPADIFQDFVDPIVGNRNPDNLQFEYVMPELFKKVTEYCNDAVLISERVENEDGDLL